jgi:hypothetical protein
MCVASRAVMPSLQAMGQGEIRIRRDGCLDAVARLQPMLEIVFDRIVEMPGGRLARGRQLQAADVGQHCRSFLLRAMAGGR